MIGSRARSIGDGRVRLREITLADASRLYAWRMHPATRSFFRSTAEVPFSDHVALLESYFRPDNRDHWFVIEEDGRPVGAIALYGLSERGEAAEWGRFVIEPSARGRGLGGQALQLLVGHARACGLRRLRCEVLTTNRAALGLYLRLGFQPCGEEVHQGRPFTTLELDLAKEP